MARALGVTEFLNKKFIEYEFEGEWHAALGNPERNFKGIIFGRPKNGKTEFCVRFAKYLTRFDRVLYNSFEQGHSKSLQDAFIRQGMAEVAGKIVVTHKETYAQMFARLKKKKSPRIVFIDSVQYVKFTVDEWVALITAFPKKCFICISHADGEEPKGGVAKAIQYDVDFSIQVKGFAAHCASRFGGGETIIIWPEGHRRYMERQMKHRPAPAPARRTRNNNQAQLPLISEPQKQ